MRPHTIALVLVGALAVLGIGSYGHKHGWFDFATSAGEETPEDAISKDTSWVGISLDYETVSTEEIRATGVRVLQVVLSTPADGVFQKDDIIVSIDGTEVHASADVIDIISAAAPGVPLAFSVMRDGNLIEFTVAPETRPSDLDLTRRQLLGTPFPWPAARLSSAMIGTNGVLDGSQVVSSFCGEADEDACPDRLPVPEHFLSAPLTIVGWYPHSNEALDLFVALRTDPRLRGRNVILLTSEEPALLFKTIQRDMGFHADARLVSILTHARPVPAPYLTYLVEEDGFVIGIFETTPEGLEDLAVQISGLSPADAAR